MSELVEITDNYVDQKTKWFVMQAVYYYTSETEENRDKQKMTFAKLILDINNTSFTG